MMNRSPDEFSRSKRTTPERGWVKYPVGIRFFASNAGWKSRFTLASQIDLYFVLARDSVFSAANLWLLFRGNHA